ncbi:MAG TPA: hypothetical protein VFG54_18380, partial [Prolixibacteraceae bacterium]|nr:hypothetical protein [Prolixibacteraceae bacterium]
MNLTKNFICISFLLLACNALLAQPLPDLAIVGTQSTDNSQFLQVAGPIADGQSKFLGCAYSNGQALNFQSYWNQLTPE